MKQNLQALLRQRIIKSHIARTDNIATVLKVKNSDLCELCYKMPSHVFLVLCKRNSTKS